MQSVKPFFSLNLSLSDSLAETKKLFLKNNYLEPVLVSEKIVFVPFWVFSYCIFKEDDKALVKHSAFKFSALNSVEPELTPVIGSFLKESKLMEEEFEPRFDVETIVKQSVIANLTEAKEIIKVMVAEKEETVKQNIILNDLKKVFVPFIYLTVVSDKKQFELIFNSVSAELTNSEIISLQNKAVKQLAKETVSDLKNPVNWLLYLGGLIASAGRGLKRFFSHDITKGVLGKRLVQILILIIIIIILFFYFG
ncbi:MAG: hypothetical protein ABH821_00520 [archaeon]